MSVFTPASNERIIPALEPQSSVPRSRPRGARGGSVSSPRSRALRGIAALRRRWCPARGCAARRSFAWPGVEQDVARLGSTRQKDSVKATSRVSGSESPSARAHAPSVDASTRCGTGRRVPSPPLARISPGVRSSLDSSRKYLLANWCALASPPRGLDGARLATPREHGYSGDEDQADPHDCGEGRPRLSDGSSSSPGTTVRAAAN